MMMMMMMLMMMNKDSTSTFLTVCLGRPRVADRVEKRRSIQWTCESCLHVNQDTDIECRKCAYAPWKREVIGIRLPVSPNQAIAGGFAQADDQPSPSWRCNACTYDNEPTDSKCTLCETAKPADKGRRSPSRSSDSTAERQRRQYFITVVTAPDQNRAPSPGKIMGTVNESTQTEENLDSPDSPNPAQRVFSRIYRLVKNRGTPTSSRDASPQTRTVPAFNWPSDSSSARWACSRCRFENSIDVVDCEKCGFEEAHPSATFPYD